MIFLHILPNRNWLNKARTYEYGESDDCGSQAVNAERSYNEGLDKCEIKRSQDADNGDPLEDAAQEPIKYGKFKRGQDEENAVKEDSVLRKRDAEKVRILA